MKTTKISDIKITLAKKQKQLAKRELQTYYPNKFESRWKEPTLNSKKKGSNVGN